MFVEGLSVSGIVLHGGNVSKLSLSAWQVSTAVLSITAKAKKKEKEKKEKEEEKMEVVSGNALFSLSTNDPGLFSDLFSLIPLKKQKKQRLYISKSLILLNSFFIYRLWATLFSQHTTCL